MALINDGENNEVVLNPITLTGDFLIESLSKDYPRALHCMQSIGKDNNIELSSLYAYHEISTKKSFLLNICCADRDNNILLQSLEQGLYKAVKNFENNTYIWSSVLVPKPIYWVGKASNKGETLCNSIDIIISRYFQNLSKITIKYYDA